METMTPRDRYMADHIASLYGALEKVVPLRSIHTKREYDDAVNSLNKLLDEGGADEDHQLAPLVDTLGTLIEAYERDHVTIPPVSGPAALRFLMEQHGLRQSDLGEIGTQGVVSELLSGKREFTSRHISALRDRFGVSADVFL